MAKKAEKKPKIENINLVDVVVLGMEELKAEDITVIDLTKIKNAVADYFIVCSGNSDAHIDGIADSVEKEVYERTQQNPWRKEGKQNREWILLDYVNTVVHVFKKEKRKVYDLESLWGDGVITHITDKSNGFGSKLKEEKTAKKEAVVKKVAKSKESTVTKSATKKSVDIENKATKSPKKKSSK